mmetsp:Transcript_6629/g.9506  ORF Transcript_6629/g.9506 Transcript_6629/m.9506 type:complete len:101 (-) Transcript_6629:1130-1432(-)
MIVLVSVCARVIKANVIVAAKNTPKPIFSFFTLPINMENIDDPAIHETMNVANKTPKGISPPPPNSLIAGVHINTNIYIDPSNNEQMSPVYRICFELIVV